LKSIADVDKKIQSEARTISMTLTPKKDIDKLIEAWEQEHLK